MDKNDQTFLVQKIRTQYMEADPSALEQLKKLDKKVMRPAYIFACCFAVLRPSFWAVE